MSAEKSEFPKPWLYRLVGLIAIVHALLGLLFSFGTYSIVPALQQSSAEIFNKEKIEQEMAPHLDKMTEEEKNSFKKSFDALDSKTMIEAVRSKGFERYVYTLVYFGIGFSLALLITGVQLIRLRPQAASLLTLVMIVFYCHTRFSPQLVSWSTGNLALDQIHFGAAWGVGNTGIGFLVITRFWIWGPILALFARENFRKREKTAGA